MRYCIKRNGKDKSNSANELITNTLENYPLQLYGFTRSEYDSIVEYDIINIMAFFYSKMNAEQKNIIQEALENYFSFSDIADTLDKISYMLDEDEVYMPLSYILMNRVGDSNVVFAVYETLFEHCNSLLQSEWNSENSYSNYLILLNIAYFEALSNKLKMKNSYNWLMKSFYDTEDFDSLSDYLYYTNSDNYDWDIDVDFDFLEDYIASSKVYTDYFEEDDNDESENIFLDAINIMDSIRRTHTDNTISANNKSGFAFIVEKTGINESISKNISGFDCHFCISQNNSDKYIIVYQNNAHINDIIDDDEKWSAFQKEIYKEDIRQNNSNSLVYIIYILDNNSENIPIQKIESNKIYARKYVFSENETITFINGIVKTSSNDSGLVSPVQEWDRILRTEHLTACMTEAYSAKKVESYLSGQRFDADYIHDDDYASMKRSDVPQIKWIRNLNTTGFRDFCFDKKTLTFGQINLLYGANGSGKTSVLEGIEYALTSEVRRVKDFKVKMPTNEYPELSVYDTEAGIHTFTPDFSKKNCKEIEKVLIRTLKNGH